MKIMLNLFKLLFLLFASVSFLEADESVSASSDFAIEEMTVYGTSNSQSVFDYPGSVDVLSREEIEFLSPSTISDVFSNVAGVEFSSGPRRTGEIPSIRGLGGDNVLILLDGARQSFSSAHDGRFFLDPDLLKKAEVVKGPASGLYGSGATGGVLAFETVNAMDLLEEGSTKGGRLKFGHQSVNDEFLGNVTTFGMLGSFDLLASFGIRQSGDIELGSGAELSSDDEIDNYLIKGGFTANDWRIEGSWQKFDNDAIEPNNGQGVAAGNDVDKDVISDNFRGSIAFNPASEFINAKITAYHNETEVKEFDQSLNRDQSREVDSVGISFKNVSNFRLGASDTALTIGGNWYEDEQTGTDDSTGDGTRGGVPDAEAEFYGFFAQAELSLDVSEELNILFIPSIRYDHFKSSAQGQNNNSDKAWSPRFSMSIGTDAVRLFSSYSEGFRAPSINELYLDGVHFGIPHPILGAPTVANNNFTPNTNLKPEKTDTFETGLSFNFGGLFSSDDKLKMKASYYDTNVEDFIDTRVNFAFDRTCFIPRFFSPCSAGTTDSANITDAEIAGLELEGSYENRLILFRANYSTIDGTDETTGADIGTLTPNRLNLDLRLKLTDLRAVAGVRLKTAGSFDGITFSTTTNRFTVNDARSGYITTDLYSSWQPVFAPGFRLDFGIENLFDKDFERVFQGVSEPGINVKTALTFQKSF